MNAQEILKALVMSESQDERMTLAEQLTELMAQNNPQSAEETLAKITELETALESTKTDLISVTEERDQSKQKYIDRFFSGEEPKKEEEKPEEKQITTDDIVEEMGGSK